VYTCWAAMRQMNRRGVARSDPGTDFAQRRRLVARGPVKVRSFDDGEQHTAMYDQHGMHVVVFEFALSYHERLRRGPRASASSSSRQRLFAVLPLRPSDQPRLMSSSVTDGIASMLSGTEPCCSVTA
jgi:hypothetical protein